MTSLRLQLAVNQMSQTSKEIYAERPFTNTIASILLDRMRGLAALRVFQSI
jgi:hypothetical protein